MPKHFFLTLSLSILITCHTEADGPLPEGVLKEDQMVDLLLDIHLYEGLTYKQRELPQDSMYKLQAYFRKAILLQHEVEDSIYELSLSYYETHPRQYHKVYERLIDSLAKRSSVSSGR